MLYSRSIVKILINGGIGVLPTDTLYGLVGQALSKRAVSRIYKLKKRNPRKPMLILIGSIKDLNLFKIKFSKKRQNLLLKFWPGRVSIILSCSPKKFSYLHRGIKTLAFRLPKKLSLIRLLRRTGPLVAPSANPERLKPAKTIKEAKKYFGDKVDFYFSQGKLISLPSTLIAIKNGKIIIKRKGAFDLNLRNLRS